MAVIEQRPIPTWLENEVKEYFLDYSFTPKTILDIGANIGAFAVKALETWPNATITCCEPMPFNVVQLRYNIKNKANIISAAITDFNGIDDIFIGDNFVTGSFVNFGRQTNQTLTVECLHAKELPSSEFIKVDTEGMEVTIIKNLDLTKTKVLAFEYHSEEDAKELNAFLSPNFKLIYTNKQKPIGTSIYSR